MRKFIRKILKLINRDNLLKNNNIDPNKYNSDKVYKIIKKFKIPYNTLTKDSILTLILNFDKNSKNGKIENSNFLLKNKQILKKNKDKNKENLYNEKINKRKISSIKTRINKEESENDKEENDSSSEFEINSSNVYSVKVKKITKEKKLKIKNGIFFIFNFIKFYRK